MTTLSQQTIAQKVGAQDDTYRLVRVRVPPELHEDLRRLAFDQRTSFQSILLDALKSKLQREKKGGK